MFAMFLLNCSLIDLVIIGILKTTIYIKVEKHKTFQIKCSMPKIAIFFFVHIIQIYLFASVRICMMML